MTPKTHPNDGAFAAVADGWTQCGLTKRELFAAMAMQGILARDEGTKRGLLVDAVRFADALLAELAKEAK